MVINRAVSRLALIASVALISTAAFAQATLTGNSYTQDFDGIGSGLPTGWTVRTGASATALGSTASFTTVATTWADTAGAFKNVAGASAGSAASTATQAATADRALGVRQSGSFGDPGASFVFQIADTIGLSNFQLSLDAQMLSVQPRSTTWTIDYAVGAAPTSFLSGASYTDPGVFGSTGFNISLDPSVDNQSQNVWIRVSALSASTGSGTRDTFGINNVNLTYSLAAVPEPGTFALLGLAALPGVALLRRRK